MGDRWRSKAAALVRLAEDQRGKPEGDLAKEKLLQIITKHPEAAQYEPVVKLTMADIAWMKKQGISLGGSWTGRDLAEAIALMEADYRQRMERGNCERLRPIG